MKFNAFYLWSAVKQAFPVESEDRYRTLIENQRDFVCCCRPDTTLTFVNRAYCCFLGKEPEELLGKKWAELIPESYREEILRKYVWTTPIPEVISYEIKLADYQGKTYWIHWLSCPIFDRDGKLIEYHSVGRDVTERIQYLEQLKYATLHDLATGIYNKNYFEEEVQRFEKSRDYPITIISADVDNLKLINDAIGHEKGDQLLKVCAKLLGKAIRSSDILARMGGDEFSILLPRTDEVAAEEIVERIDALIDAYNAKHRELPLSISIGVASAYKQGESLMRTLDNADNGMYRDKLQKGEGLKAKILNTLMVALGEKDYITEGHAQRLTRLSKNIGEKMGLSQQQLNNLALLAQIHDIGKVGVPDSVLSKEGPLTREERNIMKLHAEKGYRIALTSPDLSHIAHLILKHHERWDGKGYPLGLRGEEIPIECRIISILDAYDAMTNDRPYRKAISQEEAMEELKRKAGSQFDPRLVEVVLLVLKEEMGAPVS
ncbi:MAG TPA: diguanylate cyclase [Firmicutes bacterium]|nr:diguanylate cyclase [Bacillota bacterium]